MNFKPILFSTEMVKAILSASKVQTRRVVKPQPPEGYDYLGTDTDRASGESIFYACWEGDQFHNVKCPYGQVGDVLWVRETFAKIKSLETGLTYSLPKADFEYYKDKLIQGEKVKWKPSIHMPKEACRLFLKIKSIRVERLQDISEEDSLAEGIHGEEGSVSKRKWYRKFVSEDEARSKGLFTESAKECFQSLWQSINGEESWNSNPWVWVIEFERIEKPEKFLAHDTTNR